MMPMDVPESAGTDQDAVTFVNTFEVHGSPEEFERAFAETAEFIRHQPGLLQYNLLRHTEDPGRYINVARWTSAEALHRAVRHPEFRPHAEALRAVSTSTPDLYTSRQVFQPAQ